MSKRRKTTGYPKETTYGKGSDIPYDTSIPEDKANKVNIYKTNRKRK